MVPRALPYHLLATIRLVWGATCNTEDCTMPNNLTLKIINDHLVGGELRAAQEIAVRLDQTLLQDATGTMAALQFAELGLERVAVPLAVQYVDHNIIQLDFNLSFAHLQG